MRINLSWYPKTRGCMHKTIILVLVASLSGCACLENRPALRTALIATGAAVLGGAISHARDNDPKPVPRFRDPKCHDKDDCR
jgi:hypothetical protein